MSTMPSDGADRGENSDDPESPRSWSGFKSKLRDSGRALLPMMSMADQAVVSGTSFVTAVIIGRNCTQHDLGVYYLVLTFTFVLVGLHEAVISGPFAIFGARRPGDELAVYRGSIWVHHWILTAISAVVIFILAVVLTATSADRIFVSAVQAVFVAAPLILLREAIRFFAYARLRVGIAFAVDVTVAALQLGSLFLLWYFGQLTVPRVLLVMGGACLLGGLSSFLFEPPSSQFVRDRFATDWNDNWEFAKWTLLSFTIGNTIPMIMPWIVGLSAGTAATGIFGAASTLLGATNVLVLGTGNFLKPKAAETYSSHGVRALRRVLLVAALFFGVIFGAVCVAAVFSGDWAMVLVYGPSFHGTGTILAALAANVLVGSLGLIVSLGLLALGMSRVNFLSDICWSVATILAALVLVPPYGAVGAAVASLIGTTSTTVMRTTSLYLAMRSLEMSAVAQVSAAKETRNPFAPPGLPCHEVLETA